jgi:hypothetical protein
MNKQFAELKVFELGGIAFCEATETVPFLVLPKGQATIKPWGPSGFVFENIITGDVIAFVSEYDDILDSAGNPYDATQLDVITALAAFFFELGGGAAGDLANVLIAGNTSGANDIIFNAGQGLQLDNFSRLREGTIDAGTGGVKGIAQICGAGYELKWEAGVQYVMGSSGNTIRISLYNFNNAPTVNDDNTKGYYSGSRWALDNGTVYVCSDATIGAAVWAIQQINYLDFNTAAAHTVVEGELAWNSTDGTLDLGLPGGFKNKVGQQLVVRARNTSGSLISKGSVVKVVGVAGGLIGINLAQADNDTNSGTAFGIVAEDIEDSSNGFVVINGIIHGLNTNAFTEGDILYISPTVAGEITNVKPVSPSHLVVVGYVAKKSAVDGHILLHVQNGYELDELHNVSIAGEANNEALVYESATALWKNKTIGGWNYIVKPQNQDVTNSITLVDDTDMQFSVVAGGQYMIEMNVVISANSTTGDYKNAFLVSAGTMKGSGILIAPNATAVAGTTAYNVNAANITTAIAIGTNAADIDLLASIKIIFSFTASANATFKYQFAQNNAIAATTARTFKGSILKYKKIN